MITVGIIILMIWGMYITTLIYSNDTDKGMNKTEKCIEPMTAQTKICNSNVYTHFGNPFGDYP